MAQAQAAIDPFGLDRLAQSIRANRQEKRQAGLDEQNAITRGLQQESLGLGIQEKRGNLADLAATNAIKQGAFSGSQENPKGESDVAFKIKFFNENNRPDLAQQIFDVADKRIKSISAQSPEAGAELFNRDLAPGLGIEPIEFKTDTNFGPAFQVVDPKTKQLKLMVQDKKSGEFKDAEGLEGLQIVDKKVGTGKGDLQKTGAFLVKDDEGNTSIAIGVFDKSTGNIRTETTEIPNANLVSKLGETGAEQTERKVEQKQLETRVVEEERRVGELIERGTLAAESTATIRRAINLLGDVKTGGFSAAALKAKQIFGIESADEGELSNSLGKAVLSQLRETFGAAFTENEGKRLERIEASFGKSTEANKRLLTQALRIAERTAKRARASAEKRGDTDTINDIDELLSFNLDIAEDAEQEPVTATNENTGEKVQLIKGEWKAVPKVPRVQ